MLAERPLYINGRFLAKPVTGCERFAREIVWAFDRLLVQRRCTTEVKFLAPKGTPRPDGLSRIGFEIAGSRRGHLWEQLDLLLASRKGTLLNLINCGPILHSRQLTIIHDAAVFKFSQNFSKAYLAVHSVLPHLLACGSRLTTKSRIGTVSEFSRQELSAILGLREVNMPILSNGHEHILRHAPETDILDKLGIRSRRFFLFVGSPVPNKNLSRSVEAFSQLNRSDCAFVFVGSMNYQHIFPKHSVLNGENIIAPGRLTDGQIVALYRNAVALVFPSLYEGFGIPPLEAMTLGCPVIASNIPPVKEVCDDAALYFDPLNVSEMTETMRNILERPEVAQMLTAKGLLRSKSFSWDKSAEVLFEIMNN